MSYRTVSVEVCLSEFSDEEIIDEVRDRQLEAQVNLPQGAEAKEIDVREHAGDVQRLLMTRRHDKATAAMQDLMSNLLPPALVAAFVAMTDGRYAEAICDLDDFMEPSPAVTAKQLPVKPAPTAGAVTN